MRPTPPPIGPQPQAGFWGGILPPVAVLAAGCFAFGLNLGQPGHVQAAELGTADSDGDGLVDSLEQIRWTDPFQADTDGDGFDDLEELARHSDPTDGTSIPGAEAGGANVGLGVYAQGDKLTTLIAIYTQGNALAGRNFELGLAFNGTGFLLKLPPQIYLSDADISFHPTSEPGGMVILVESRFPTSLVHAFGGLKLYSTLSAKDNSAKVESADAYNLTTTAGVIMEYVSPPSWMLPPVPESTSVGTGGVAFSTQAAAPGATLGTGGPPFPGHGGTSGGLGATGLFRPISTGSSLPSSWSPNQVCIQMTTVVGGSGALLTTEVTSATCQEIDNVGCSGSNCSGSVGTTNDVLDPITLIGG